MHVKITGGPHTREIAFTDSVTGAKIHGIAAADIKMRPNDIVRTTIDILSQSLDVSGEADFTIIHPITGERRKVRSIEFEGGDIWHA